MNLKKLFLVAFAAFLLPIASLSAQAVTDLSPEEQLLQAEFEKQQIITICQQMQMECSKQVDLLTAILQQIMGGIQKGIMSAPGDKSELINKISAYASLSHQLQSMSVLTAEPEILIKVTVILKNIIDRLTVAVDSGLVLLDTPEIEDLLVPDKNYSDSFDYILKVLNKNDERLSALAISSTSLGLTTLNKTLRATEDFFQSYKWPLVGAGVIAGLGTGVYLYKSDEFMKNMAAHIDALTKEQAYKEYFSASAVVVGLSGALFHKKLGEVGSLLIDNGYQWGAKNYRKLSNKLSEIYSAAKGIKNIKKDGLATVLENVPTLDDPSFFGLEYQISQFKVMLNYLADSELYLRADNDIPKGWLLIGPSRTGKTAAAKALAATINQMFSDNGAKTKIKFIEVDYTLITNIASLKTYIDHALENAPCILFIDEIHLLGLQKTGDKGLLNEFLTQLTELHKIKDPLKQVFIIGATNHPELLAPELFKHERFGKVIRFKKPGIRERAQFFASNFEKYGINPQTVDLKSIVMQTKDCDYGHLQQIIKDARFEARAQGQGVSQVHVQRAVNSIVHGIGSTAELTKEEAQIAAIDQAGKIVMHKKLEIHETIHLATISKVDGRIEEDHFWLSEKKDTEVIPMRYGAIIATSNREEIPFSDAYEIEKLCKRYLAGICAQKIILGTYHIDYTAQDYKTAFELAQKIYLKGLTVKSLPAEQQNRVFEETEKLLQLFEVEVITLLEQHKPLIEKLVAELLKERCITGKEIDSIVN